MQMTSCMNTPVWSGSLGHRTHQAGPELGKWPNLYRRWTHCRHSKSRAAPLPKLPQRLRERPRESGPPWAPFQSCLNCLSWDAWVSAADLSLSFEAYSSQLQFVSSQAQAGTSVWPTTPTLTLSSPSSEEYLRGTPRTFARNRSPQAACLINTCTIRS